MPRLRWLRSAEADLVDILTWITHESGSLMIGRRFVADLRAKCHHLAGLPGRMGRPRSDLRDDIRSFPFRGYVIFFRYIDDRFEVVDILEGHRDAARHIGGEE